jgi:hypothetical protein
MPPSGHQLIANFFKVGAVGLPSPARSQYSFNPPLCRMYVQGVPKFRLASFCKSIGGIFQREPVWHEAPTKPAHSGSRWDFLFGKIIPTMELQNLLSLTKFRDNL